jgi:hypothetical protein
MDSLEFRFKNEEDQSFPIFQEPHKSYNYRSPFHLVIHISSDSNKRLLTTVKFQENY